MPADKTIAWLLDVDGVINVWRPTWNAKPLTVAQVCRKTIRFNGDLIDFINETVDKYPVQIIWNTTWNYYPAQLSALEDLTGIRGFRAFSERPEYLCPADQKVKAVQDALYQYDRVIWTDDEEVNFTRKSYAGIACSEAADKLLMIQPESKMGLRMGHAVAIAEWLKAWWSRIEETQGKEADRE